MNLSVVIATLLEPPTLEKLVRKAGKVGAEVIVVKDMATNDAWKFGISRAKHEDVLILNDDIEINTTFFEPIKDALDKGYTHVVPVMVSHFYPPDLIGLEKITEEEPPHKGHAFAIKKSVSVPVPSVFRISYGDDWYYWYNVAAGKPCTATEAQYKTGRYAGLNDDQSGYTVTHPDCDKKLKSIIGMTRDENDRVECDAAVDYFNFGPIPITHTPLMRDVAVGIRGPITGIKTSVLEKIQAGITNEA